MLKQWKENFVKAQKHSQVMERRGMEAQRQLQKKENEMLAWASAQTAARESIISGMY